MKTRRIGTKARRSGISGRDRMVYRIINLLLHIIQQWMRWQLNMKLRTKKTMRTMSSNRSNRNRELTSWYNYPKKYEDYSAQCHIMWSLIYPYRFAAISANFILTWWSTLWCQFLHQPIQESPIRMRKRLFTPSHHYSESFPQWTKTSSPFSVKTGYSGISRRLTALSVFAEIVQDR